MNQMLTNTAPIPVVGSMVDFPQHVYADAWQADDGSRYVRLVARDCTSVAMPELNAIQALALAAQLLDAAQAMVQES